MINSFHQAGFDAYMTGYCFIRLCHLASTIYCRDTNSMRVLRFRELLDVVTNHVNLGGAEPLSSRPPKLVVYSRDSRPLDCLALANRFSRLVIKKKLFRNIIMNISGSLVPTSIKSVNTRQWWPCPATTGLGTSWRGSGMTRGSEWRNTTSSTTQTQSETSCMAEF